MKQIALLLGTIFLFLTSCSSTYYYSTLNTLNSDVEKVDNGDFLYENDSLWIAYCFKGEDAPIQITVFNKLDIPLYIDWNRSALILNSQAYPYSNGKITFVGGSEGVLYREPLTGRTKISNETYGEANLSKHMSFIPPQTMVSHNTVRIAAQFDEIKNKEYSNAKLGTKNQETVNIKRINYDIQNTPLSFGSYLTLYTTPEDAQVNKTDFYMTNLIKTQVKPHNLPADMAERGDTFYQQKRPNNTGWYILADVALYTGAVALDVTLYGDEY